MSRYNFDYDVEFANLRIKYPSVSRERADYFCEFLDNRYSGDDYLNFIRSLSNDEFFFVLDLEDLQHRRCLVRLREFLDLD